MKVKISKSAFNKCYRHLLDEESHRYIVLYGGAGSGKSVFAAQRLIVRMLSKQLCNILVIRAVAAANRDSAFALFKQIISKWELGELFKISESDLKITCATGNCAIFKGLDDSEKLKSITFPKGELTDIWIEEASEISREDFNQLDLRLRGKGISGQITLSFNPVSILHWLKSRFFDMEEKRAVIVRSTYLDNKFLDDGYKALLEGYKETDPYYYSVYCLGEWGVFGKSVFHSENITRRLRELENNFIRGEFVYSTYFDYSANQVRIDDTSIRFKEDMYGFITIYRYAKDGIPYVIGGDTSGDGSDFFVAQVIDNTTGEQVCTLRHQFDEDIFAKQVYCLGKTYNNALIAIEANFTTFPIRELERLRYPRQYVRETEDNFTHKIKQSFGFKTTSATRPVIIAGLVEIVRESPELLNDRQTLEEMLTFVRDERGRPQAQNGAHDDCVMAAAIAFFCRGQQGMTRRVHSREWTKDMWEDFSKASSKDKERIAKKWGSPCLK